MLAELGIETAEFFTGEEAVECFKSSLTKTCCHRTFKLVLTDIQMPEMDGYQVASHILGYQKYWKQGTVKSQLFERQKMKQECKVGAVTAYTDASVKIKALKVGMKFVLNKPVTIETLKEIVAEYYL